jgi:C4-dicarboxylate transporter DctM subunit
MIVALSFIILFALLFAGVPIAFGMALVGLGGFAMYQGLPASLAMTGQILFDTSRSYELSVVPLFILMGNFISQSRLSEELYDASNAFLGHRRGGLAMATIGACAGFSAVCGSSIATAATMAKVALPSMKRLNYSDGLATASVAAGGTLGILIPPSVVLVLYGLITDNDIGKLFAAGLIPGILGAVLYIAAIRVVTAIDPASGPPGPVHSWGERVRALSHVWGVVALFVLVLGGIYAGIFTPTEAAGVGAFGAFMFALARRRLTLDGLFKAIVETGRTTAMMFFILIGALIFSNFMSVARTPFVLAEFIAALQLSPTLVIVVLLVTYVILGCFLESLSMMLLTVPVFYPLVINLGVDPIWFGVFVVVVIEISLITPPIGLNVFVIRGMAPDVQTTTIFRGIVAFIVADLVRVALLIIFPAIALFLPSLLK